MKLLTTFWAMFKDRRVWLSEPMLVIVLLVVVGMESVWEILWKFPLLFLFMCFLIFMAAIQETYYMDDDKPLLIQFTNLLHACKNCEAPAVKDFLAKHADDELFQRRAQAVMASYRMKQDFEKRNV